MKNLPLCLIWGINTPYAFAFSGICFDALTWALSFAWFHHGYCSCGFHYNSNFQSTCGSYWAVTWTIFSYLKTTSSFPKNFMSDLCNITRLGIRLCNCHFRKITRGNLEACVIKTLMPNIFVLRDLSKNNVLLVSLSLKGSGLYQFEQYHKACSL